MLQLCWFPVQHWKWMISSIFCFQLAIVVMEAQGGVRLASRSVFIWVALYSVKDVFPFSAIQVSNDKYEENEDKYLATKRETEKTLFTWKKPHRLPPIWLHSVWFISSGHILAFLWNSCENALIRKVFYHSMVLFHHYNTHISWGMSRMDGYTSNAEKSGMCNEVTA